MQSKTQGLRHHVISLCLIFQLWASQIPLVVKNPPANAGDRKGLIPWLGRSPGGGHDNPHQYSCLENHHGQRSLAGYSPQDSTESDTTKVTEHAYTHAQL